jgi:prepilin-type N-terminal cleavage/methylation domain-containing protein
MTRRSAFTLIELLVALSLFALILPLCGWLIYVLLHAQTASANSIADALAQSRFARTFRSDAHAAEKTEIIDSSSDTRSRVVFKVDSTASITYDADSSGLIVRTVQAGGATKRREEFRLTGTDTSFEQAAEGTVAAVQFPIRANTSRGSRNGAAAGAVRIEAVVGRDRRFLVSPAAHENGAP